MLGKHKKVIDVTFAWPALSLVSGHLECSSLSANLPLAVQVWKAILTEEPNYTSSALHGVSDEAKSFMKMLLNKYVHPPLQMSQNEPYEHQNIPSAKLVFFAGKF